MSSFDPAKAFQREFDEIRKVARTGSAAAKAPLKQRLLALLDLYRLKLPASMHQTRTVDTDREGRGAVAAAALVAVVEVLGASGRPRARRLPAGIGGSR